MKRWQVAGVIGITILLALVAIAYMASGRPAAPDGPTVEFWGDKHVVVAVEVADTPSERNVGLMYRKHMDELNGMLFVFDRPSTYAFYMKNTFIPLDMVYVSDNLTIVYVAENTEPLSEDLIIPDGSAKYVVEVNAGFCDKYGIEAGDVIRLNLK